MELVEYYVGEFLVGRNFMWSNGRVWSRLDKFLVSASWEDHFPDLNQKRLLRICSDHHPILLDCGGISGGWRYFRFDKYMARDDGFVDRLRLWWFSYSFSGTPSFVLTRKFKVLKQDLKKWNAGWESLGIWRITGRFSATATMFGG